MSIQKFNHDEKKSKVLEFPLPITKGAAPTTKRNFGQIGNSNTVVKLTGGRMGAGTRQSQPVLPQSPSEEELQARIAKRAYELFEQRERQHGYDRDDWFQAAKEVFSQKNVG